MRSAWRILGGIVIVCLLSLVLLQPTYQEPTALAQRGSDGSALFASHGDKDAAPNEKGPIVSEPVIPDIRPAVKDLPVYEAEYHLDREINPRLNLNPNLDPNFRSKGGIDPLLAVQAGVEKQLGDGFTSPILNFEAQGFTGVNPPDTVGDVGPNHYIHIINSGGGGVMIIYDKEGNILAGPTAVDSIGTGTCASGLGDGIVLYDRLVDRWMISEFSSSGNALCVYVSQGPDPVNDGWYAYQFVAPSFPDYPKYGVWPDAYYVTSNEGGGPGIYALDREEMLNGQPATSVRFTAPSLSGFGFQALTPTDLDGAMAPPAGSPNYIMRHRDDEVHAGTDDPDNDFLEIWAFDVDFDTPANSSFTQIADIEIAEIDSDLCGLTSFFCFPMPGSSTTLDPLREVIMWRLQYRNFGSYEVLVGNLVTDVSGNDHGGIRWFELRKSGSDPWSLFQEGTFAPDEHHRFMGSIAMDGSGNMALGYSVTSNTVFPGIRYVGRLANDPAGTMPHGETSIIEGSAANSSNRWGDYSAMSVDPADDCTFWYTNMYSPSNNWTTQVTSFKFDACGSSDFTLSANPDSQDICVPADGLYTVNVGKVQDFSDMVTLSATGNPAGTTATFSVNPVTPSDPPATSMLTISGTGGATAGNYNIDIIGMAPTSTHTTTVGLNLFDAAPDAPMLTSPADMATDVSLVPTFEWDAPAQAASYYLEVASDMAFNDIIYMAEVEGTSQALAGALDPLSTYYWRVRADNICGEGGLSDVSSFTTADVPSMVVVDDQNGDSSELGDYTTALDALGVDYDVWDTTADGGDPTAENLAPYQTIIWLTGADFGATAGPNEAELATHIDNTPGACLFLSSQDYLWGQGGSGADNLTSFMTTYLGASEGDSDVTQTTVTGAGDFSNLGPYTLSYPFTNYSDRLEADDTASVVFTGNQGNAAISKVTDNYRTTWWGFPFESIPSAEERQEAMATVLEWCGSEISITPTPTNTPGGPTLTPTPTNTPGGPTLTPTPTSTPDGPTLTPTNTPDTPTATPTSTPDEPTVTPTATEVPPVELACNGTTVDFEGGIPSNWSTLVTDGPVYWSTTADSAACGNGINQTGGNGFAACADSDQTNSPPSAPYDTEMWTPAFSLSDVPTATLQFAAAYRDINPSGDHFEVDVWDGTSWNNALNWNEDHRDPGELVEIDLTAYAGQSDVKVRFRYYGEGWDWWSQVDEVQLSCGELTEEPSIQLEKSVGTDPEACAASDSLTLPTGGGEVTYCYKVINTSNATFELHNLVDDKLGTLLNNEAQSLAPAESFTYLETTTVTTNTTNLATWTASSEGVSAEASDSAVVRIEALCGATIQSLGNGQWDDSNTWDLNRVPNGSDIVLIQEGHLVDGRSVAHVQGFCNYGTLQSPSGESLKLISTTFFKNYGQILGLSGEAGSGNSCGTLGSSLDLRGKPFLNEGTIQAGDGGDGERCGGAGGTARIMGHNSTNSGTIAAGNGGDVTTTGALAALDHPRERVGTYVGGRGGDTHLRGNFGGSGFVDNSGTLQAGDGGHGHPNAVLAQSGGNGGCLYIYASWLSLTGNHWAGLGGQGTAGGPDGMDGCVSIDPSVIDFSGPNTTVRGGDIEIFGGDDWVLDLSDMATGAISATGNLMLAVGEGGSVDLRDNESQAFQVAGEVTIASDEIELDEETELDEVIQATKVQTQAHQILVEFDLDGPGRIVIEPSSKQMLDLTVLNNGPMTDTYTLSLSDPDGWTQGSLPSSITIAGLESADLDDSVMVVPPAGVANGDMSTLTLMATSENDPTQIREFEVEVVAEGGGFFLHLPLITRD